MEIAESEGGLGCREGFLALSLVWHGMASSSKVEHVDPRHGHRDHRQGVRRQCLQGPMGLRPITAGYNPVVTQATRPGLQPDSSPGCDPCDQTGSNRVATRDSHLSDHGPVLFRLLARSDRRKKKREKSGPSSSIFYLYLYLYLYREKGDLSNLTLCRPRPILPRPLSVANPIRNRNARAT